jgi:hypothetical protein
VTGPDGRAHKFPNGTKAETIIKEMSKTYGGSPKALQPQMSATEKNLGQRYQRYDRYFGDELARLAMVPNSEAALFSLAAIQQHGLSDGQESQVLLAGPERQKCASQCKGAPQCVVDCMDAINPMGAKVLGCQILPDELPY